VFDTDDAGRVTGLHVMGAQLFSMRRIAWYETVGVTVALLGLFVGLLLVATAALPAGALSRRLRRRDGETPQELRRVRRLSGIAAGVALGFIVGFALHFVADWPAMLQISGALRALLVLPLIAAGLTVALASGVAQPWRRRAGSTAARLYHTGIALGLLAFLPFLYHLRLLGFHY
jgi:fructose-specific phosphotransferase system IIC component